LDNTVNNPNINKPVLFMICYGVMLTLSKQLGS
jgi:hypothetical protein